MTPQFSWVDIIDFWAVFPMNEHGIKDGIQHCGDDHCILLF